MFPTVTMCTQLRTLRTGNYAPAYSYCIKCTIHNTQRHEIHKEAITYILNVVNRNNVNVFKAM